jgi:dephospho-CoA kinase
LTVDLPRPILRAGLTGGIASGKTTVAGFLADLGALVLDADRIAHQAMEPGGDAYDDVVSRFGPDILDTRGRIVRRRLAERIFSDGTARRALDRIVHPKVLAEIERRIERYLLTGGHALVAVLDAALIVESGLHKTLQRLIVVRCSRDAQLRRLIARGDLTPDEAVARIDAQASLEERLAVADYVIDTETTIRETRRQTGEVWGSLLRDFERLFGGPGSR